MRHLRFLVVVMTFVYHSPHALNAQTCGGFERWAVKVGSDRGISSVDFNSPVMTSLLHDLVNLPQPTMPSQGDNTTRTSLERTVRVVDARLAQLFTSSLSGTVECRWPRPRLRALRYACAGPH